MAQNKMIQAVTTLAGLLIFLAWPELKDYHFTIPGTALASWIGIGWFYAWRQIGDKKNWEYSFLYWKSEGRDLGIKARILSHKHTLYFINILILLLFLLTFFLEDLKNYSFVPHYFAVVLVTFWAMDLLNAPPRS